MDICICVLINNVLRNLHREQLVRISGFSRNLQNKSIHLRVALHWRPSQMTPMQSLPLHVSPHLALRKKVMENKDITQVMSLYAARFLLNPERQTFKWISHQKDSAGCRLMLPSLLCSTLWFQVHRCLLQRSPAANQGFHSQQMRCSPHHCHLRTA